MTVCVDLHYIDGTNALFKNINKVVYSDQSGKDHTLSGDAILDLKFAGYYNMYLYSDKAASLVPVQNIKFIQITKE